MILKEKLWFALIQLKVLIDSYQSLDEIYLNKEYLWMNEASQEDLLKISFKKKIPEVVSSSFNTDEYKQLRLYLSYLLINRNEAMAKVFLHVAQTLDGKIALKNGNSQWIGNQANRTHSHRIRALVDAVIVGGRTFRIDKPKLNVRHVKGEDPRVVVITGNQIDFHPHQTDAIVFTSNENLDLGNNFKGEMIVYPTQKEVIPISFILKELKGRGIHTVLLEGGQNCIKQFISEQLIHQLEFHIAPMIFGSGINAVSLDEIDQIDKSICLNDLNYYDVEDELMVVSQNINYGS